MSKRLSILTFLLAMLFLLPTTVSANDAKEKEDGGLDVKEIIFEHLGDGYGWEVPFSHTNRIPLPVIVRAQDGNWFCFSSADLTEKHEVADPETCKTEDHVVRVVKTIERDGKTYQFLLATASSNKDKVVQIFPLEANDEPILKKATVANEIVDGYVLHVGQYYREYRPFDMSITKNVLALFITVIVVCWMVLALARFYKKNGLKAPRKGLGFIELIFSFVYYDTIKPALGKNTNRFAPYLLTAFFFILVMNLLGLIVVFPGGANLTGNIAITLVLALCTFVLTNVLGTKHYWKDIFWPDVPVWLKCPIPIMQLIEVFGIFTKPAALCVRLFANMMGGHMIVITLTLLIFIFAAFGAGVAGAASVVSVLFSVFMLLLDVLVSFIQAYVFTLLSAMFISMAQIHEENHESAEGEVAAVAEN
jgi:F-type H+-transporting ATPase subunit a